MRIIVYRVFVFLCIAHPIFVTTAIFYYENVSHPDTGIEHLIRILFPWEVYLWPLWAVALWFAGARRWRLALPLIVGFVALVPLLPLCLLYCGYGGGH
jgi:hypothetical protein